MTATIARPVAAAPTRRGGRAIAGIAAQGSQAATSFGLQFVAARMLGLEGLGTFGTVYALVLLATSIASGFVGDSLTVLDRDADDVRAGLTRWLLIISALAAVSCAGISAATGFLPAGAALAFGAAAAAFLVEDSLRRWLMARLEFWRIVGVDLTALAGSLLWLLGSRVVVGEVTLTTLLLALAVGQLAAVVVARRLLPPVDRRVRLRGPAAMRVVAAYGAWRAVQQGVRTGMLAAMRLLCLLVVTDAAVGSMEAARIYMAPTVILVGGVSSYLFASYAAQSDRPLAAMLHRADRTVLRLAVALTLVSAVAVVAMPLLGPVLTGGEYHLSRPMAIGWAAYAAALAATTPYGQLAAVRGRQRAVLGVRIGDSVLSLAAVYAVLELTSSTTWVPLTLAVGSLLGGLTIRHGVLGRAAADVSAGG